MNTDLDRALRETLSERQASIRQSHVAPEVILRRARRRSMRTIAVGVVAAAVVVASSIGGIGLLLDRAPSGRLGGADDVLPTEGPAPGESSLLLASGANDGEPWSLRVTESADIGLGLFFGYDELGGGGGDLSPMRGGRIFQGYGGSSSPDYPDHDPTRPPLPIGIAGQLAVEAERVELVLNHGPVVEASIYPLPNELVGPAKVFLLFVPGDTLVMAGELVAYDAAGAELGREYFDISPVSLFPKVLEESPPEAVVVMKDLQLAGSVVAQYFNEHGSFSGLDPASASAISYDVAYNTSPTAIPGEVSIRVSGPQSLVLASATADAAIYSVCMDHGPGGGVYGRNDTSDPQACTNGWLDPSGEPLPADGEDRLATGSDPSGNLWSLTLLEVNGAETPFELELLIGPIGTYGPIEPIDDADVGNVWVVPPTSTPVDAPPVDDLPTSVYGLVSGRVARLELRVDGGRTYDADLYPIPPGSIDAEQAFLVLVPVGGPMTGTVVAFDADGEELQRRHVESSG